MTASSAARRFEYFAILPHLYVHYDDGAVSHLFHVAAGLDSMAVGEAQILGQTRDALRRGPGARHGRPGAQRAVPAGPPGRQARARRDRHRPRRAVPGRAPALARVAGARRPGRRQAGRRRRRRLDGRPRHRHRRPARRRRRSPSSTAPPTSAERLAAEYAAAPAPLADLADALADADLSSPAPAPTGRPGRPAPWSQAARPTRRAAGGRRPRPAARRRARRSPTLPGRHPGRPGRPGRRAPRQPRPAREVDDVRRIVGRGGRRLPRRARRQASVTPTVVALRSMATAVVDAEMERLDHPAARTSTTAPAPRSCRPCAGSPTSCSTSRPSGSRSSPTRPARSPTPRRCAELFALDPEAVDAVTRRSPTPRARLAAGGAAMTAPVLRLGTRASAARPHPVAAASPT